MSDIPAYEMSITIIINNLYNIFVSYQRSLTQKLLKSKVDPLNLLLLFHHSKQFIPREVVLFIGKPSM